MIAKKYVRTNTAKMIRAREGGPSKYPHISETVKNFKTIGHRNEDVYMTSGHLAYPSLHQRDLKDEGKTLSTLTVCNFY